MLKSDFGDKLLLAVFYLFILLFALAPLLGKKHAFTSELMRYDRLFAVALIVLFGFAVLFILARVVLVLLRALKKR